MGTSSPQVQRMLQGMGLVRGNMFRRWHGCIWLIVIAIHASIAFAQESAPQATPQTCDKTCQQQKVDALFKAMDEAASQLEKPSHTADCTVYDGHDRSDVFQDVCAKLKYVRSLPAGKTSRFPCPRDTSALIGASARRIASAWGEPDFRQGDSTLTHASSNNRWTYFLGRVRPGWTGGGFAEVTLYVADDIVQKVDCGLAQ